MRTALMSSVVIACLLLSGCPRSECSLDADCADGFLCRTGLCVIDANGGDGGTVGADSDAGTVTLDCRAATAEDLVLNEILADPGGSDFDGDGDPSNYDSSGDEYVELVNIAAEAVGTGSVEILVAGKSPVKVTALCLEPNEAHVHWGRDGKLGLTNSGGTVSLLVNGLSAQSHTYGSEADKDQSITLATQLDPTSDWVMHSDIAATNWSPGACANGNAFPNCDGPGIVDADAIGGDGEVPPPCEADTPGPGELVINEVLADPGSVVDANGDGAADGDDEFVEIVNTSGAARDISGVTVEESSGVSYTVPPGTCLALHQALVVFARHSGGSVGGSLSVALGKSWQLNNTGDVVTLLDASGETLDSVEYGSNGGDDQSVVRWPELATTSALTKHEDVPGSAGPASPGTCANGNPFPACEAPPIDDDATLGDAADGDVAGGPDPDLPPPCGVDAVIAGPGALVLNEILADPPTGADLNGNGATGTDDEFVEIVNTSGAMVDLSDVELLTGELGAEGVVLTFKSATGEVCLDSGSGIVIFGGSVGTFAPADALVWTSDKSLSLNNSGDSVVLRAADGTVIDGFDYGSASDESWTRSPDASGLWSKHTAAEGAGGAAYSPGACTDGSAFAFCL